MHLVAHPASGWELAGWSGACKGAGSCAVKLTASKAVHVTFKLVPVPPPNTTPPSQTARPGHYSGTNSLGKPLTFDVAADGTTVTGFVTNVDVNCTEIQGFTLNEPLDPSAVPFTVKPDLTFGDGAQETFRTEARSACPSAGS